MELGKSLRGIGLKTKIIGAISFAIILTTIAGSTLFYARTKTIIFNDLQKRGKIICQNLSYSAKYGVLTEDTVVLKELVEGIMRSEDVAYAIIQNDQGKTLAEKTAVEVPDMASLKKKSLLAGDFDISSTRDKFDNPIYNFSYPIIARKVSLTGIEETESGIEKQTPAQRRGTVQVGLSLSPVLQKLRDVLQGILVLTVIVIAGGVIFSLGFARIIMKPIGEMTKVAIKIASGDLSQTVEAETYDEIGQFACQFNAMTGALKKREEQLRESYRQISLARDQLEVRVRERTAELTAEIARRKKAEERKDQLLKELESVNQELKDFAYVASHDLKAPLRGISTLAEWIATDYADKLDEEGKNHLKLLIGRTERMHNLIDGILQYSRVGRVKEEQVQVDLNRLVPEVTDMIGPPENIKVEIENELPTLLCEQTRITQVFQNLLSNAIKYIDKPNGRIRIGCVRDNGYWKFSVADNGPGIEKKNFEKIFQMFQTLAPRDQYESTGIGLTVVKKIIELYGGKIWVESEVGSGSTFFFTLPVQNKELISAN